MTLSSFYGTLTQVHNDDIHGTLKISENTFVSGSKDTTIKHWEEGSLEGRVVQALTPGKAGYGYWVTALSKLNDDQWLSGSRDGTIKLWNQQGTCTAQISIVGKHFVCKARNQTRICSLASSYDMEDTFFTGTPGRLIELSTKSKYPLSITHVALNDWVYTIVPFAPSKLLLTIGSRLEVWDRIKGAWKLHEKIITGHPHPLISSVEKLQGDHVALCDFGGSVKVIDVFVGTTLFEANEHQGLAWKVEALDEHTFASGADDALVKIWDVRQKRAAHTTSTHSGRVSSLLKLNEATLIAGSCPKNPFTSKQKACLTFWDRRFF